MADTINTTVKTIKRAAKQRGINFHMHRAGAKHAIYRLGEVQITIPHSRIHHRTVHLIYRECEPALGRGWWRNPNSRKQAHHHNT